MSNSQNIAIAPDVDLTHETRTLVTETTSWLTDNSFNVLLAIGAGVAIALVLLGVRSIGCRLIEKGKGELKWRVVFANAIAQTGFFFIVMVSAELVTTMADAPPRVRAVTHFLFVIAAAFQGAIWARELVLGYVEHRVGPEQEHSTLGSAVGIIRLLVSIALFAVATIVILDNLGVNVTGLLAGLGIGGIAIGLAAKGVFEDLFAALSIIFDKPFRRGDSISFGKSSGTVEQIGLKTTRIRSVSGEEVVVANANLLNQELQNWTLLQRRRAVMTLGVTYQTPPDMLARIPLEVKEIVEAQPLATFDRCHAATLAASSIDYELVFFVETAAYGDFMSTKQAVILSLVRRFAELGVDFAYPTQTSFTAGPDGKAVLPYACDDMATTGEREEKPAAAMKN